MSSDNRAKKTWTQGQVRETFVRGREQHADFRGINNSRAEFESWLAAHDAEVLAGARREALKEAAAVMAEIWGVENVADALRQIAEGVTDEQ
jgi:hypothetical protein